VSPHLQWLLKGISDCNYGREHRLGRSTDPFFQWRQVARGAMHDRDGFTGIPVEAGHIVRLRRQGSHPETDGQPTNENGGGAERHGKSPLSPDSRGASGGCCEASEHHSHCVGMQSRTGPIQ